MALNRHVLYGDRWDATDTSSSTQVAPQGAFRDKDDGQLNGSYLNSAWANDCFSGLNGAFLANVHQADGTPAGYSNPFNASGYVDLNGNEDTAQSSQVYNAWYKKTSDIVDAKIEELITLTNGCWFNWYSGGVDSVTDVIIPTGSDYESVDFTADADTASPIYLGNNITVDSADSTILNFAKAGTYFFKPTLFLNKKYTPAGKMKLLISKPSDNGSFNAYFNALKIEKFSTWAYAESGTTSTNMYPYRSGSIFNSSNPVANDAGNWYENILHYGLIAPSLFVVIDEDDSKVQIDIKEADLAEGYNMSLEFQRVGGATLSSPYMAPTDLIVTP